jgi:hypothetical protein
LIRHCHFLADPAGLKPGPAGAQKMTSSITTLFSISQPHEKVRKYPATAIISLIRTVNVTSSGRSPGWDRLRF